MHDLYVLIISVCKVLKSRYLHTVYGVGREVRFYNTKDKTVNLYMKYCFDKQKYVYRGTLFRNNRTYEVQRDLITLLDQAIVGWLDYETFVTAGAVIDVHKLLNSLTIDRLD